MRRHILGALLAACVLACTRGASLAGARFAPIGRTELATEYRRLSGAERDFALLHVLFVPEIEAPAGGAYGAVMAGGGSVDHYELHFSYSDQARSISVQASPVTIVNDRVVEAGGRSFDLANGNVFVANVAATGGVKLRQIRKTLDDKETSPDAVMSVIRAAGLLSGRR